MSRPLNGISPDPLDNAPGLQYPSDINLDPSNPTGFALKNAFDNLFYLRRKVVVLNPGLTKAEIEALIRRATKITGGNPIVIVGDHVQRTTQYSGANLPIGTIFFEDDRTSTYIVSSQSGTKRWVYSGGSMTGLFGDRPTDLNTYDAGFNFTSITPDQETSYLWDGSEWVTVGGYLQEVSDAETNAVTTVNVRRHLTSGAATTGYGIGVQDELEDSAGITQAAALETVDWTSAGTNTSRKRWWLRVAGVMTQCLELISTALTVLGNVVIRANTAFTGTITHVSGANVVWTMPAATGNITYQTATLTNNNFTFGGGGALVKDAGFAMVPVANGGTNANTAAGARTSLGAAAIQAVGGGGPGTYTLFGPSTNGSFTVTTEGTISAVTAAT